MEGKSITGAAAQRAHRLSHNVYSDWFLPSKDELNLMHENLAQDSIGGFASNNYWSSSEVHEITAWYQDFNNGSQGNSTYDKGGNLRGRAVRTF
jgi:hypothetical protein